MKIKGVHGNEFQMSIIKYLILTYLVLWMARIFIKIQDKLSRYIYPNKKSVLIEKLESYLDLTRWVSWTLRDMICWPKIIWMAEICHHINFLSYICFNFVIWNKENKFYFQLHIFVSVKHAVQMHLREAF